MIVLDKIEQGTRAWIECRLGVVTASQASRIVTASGRLSAQRKAYMADILTEWITGEPAYEFSTEWTEYGTLMEPRAREFYELMADATVEQVGFIYRDESREVGCSPDGIIRAGESRIGLELKCPAPRTHMAYYLDGTRGMKDYWTQLQFQIWCGLASVDFCSFHPAMPYVLHTAEPDAKMQAAFDEHVPAFLEELCEAKERLAEEGYGPK